MKLVAWGLVLVVLGYGAYAGMMSAWSYLQVAEVVDQAVSNPPAGSATNPMLLRQAVLARASEAGLALDGRNVVVAEVERGFEVQVAWTFPVIVMNGDTVLAVPLSHTRGVDRVGARR
jgi:hypothetical protein